MRRLSFSTFKKSPLGATLAGCPLDERISEFQKVKTEGLSIGALAIITVDNPLCAATGHRICNDCMKSCIYQKQEPVNIPEAETRTLKDVLELPWGYEIYSLLTRWNPLNLERPYPAASTGKTVLVAGMGPAGFSLAHFLMNDGHAVVGIDGLKIEPLPPELCGVDGKGQRVAFAPVRDIAELQEPLDDRVMAGFGGVAEYGITVRWDKNFLQRYENLAAAYGETIASAFPNREEREIAAELMAHARAIREEHTAAAKEGRPQDRAFVGNIVDAMHAYATDALGGQPIALKDADRVVAIGSDRMMAAVAQARHGLLKPYLKACHVAIGSINSPMQCMMKEICAQCLQPHVDAVTGETTYVFSCFNQDQPLDQVDWAALNSRLRQNGAPERLTSAWIGHCLRSTAADVTPVAG